MFLFPSYEPYRREKRESLVEDQYGLWVLVRSHTILHRNGWSSIRWRLRHELLWANKQDCGQHLLAQRTVERHYCRSVLSAFCMFYRYFKLLDNFLAYSFCDGLRICCDIVYMLTCLYYNQYLWIFHVMNIFFLWTVRLQFIETELIYSYY